MDPDGPATWLVTVTLELNPAAISLCAIAVEPNGSVRHRWLAGGVHRLPQRISPPWATPPFGRDPSVLEAGDRHAVKRPVKLKNRGNFTIYKNTDQIGQYSPKKIFFDKYKYIYSEKRLQGLY